MRKCPKSFLTHDSDTQYENSSCYAVKPKCSSICSNVASQIWYYYSHLSSQTARQSNSWTARLPMTQPIKHISIPQDCQTKENSKYEEKEHFHSFFFVVNFKEVIWFLFVNTAKTENMQELQIFYHSCLKLSNFSPNLFMLT